MKISNIIIDLGRAVAYYPGLKKIIPTTNACVLLCQLLYWTDKTRNDGWIYKTSDDIQEETGLTYKEQVTARKHLVESKLISEHFARLDKSIRFKVNQEELNRQWEEATGNVSQKVEVKGIAGKNAEDSLFKALPTVEPTVENKRTDIAKKGDYIDGMMDAMLFPGMKITMAKQAIKDIIEKRLKIIVPSDKRWKEFIDFAYTRFVDKKEHIDKFIDYAQRNGFDPMYWTPNKMQTVWPQAFIEDNSNKIRADFVEKLPERREENYVPMPKEFKRTKLVE